jgi:hypothetical protein
MYRIFSIVRFVNSIATSFVYSLSFKYHSVALTRSLLQKKKGVMVIMIRLAQYHILVATIVSYQQNIQQDGPQSAITKSPPKHQDFNYAIKIRKE